MELTTATRLDRVRGRTRQRRLLAGTTLAALVLGLGTASSALAVTKLQEEFIPFADCPVETAAVCLIAHTTGGEFKINHKTVPIEKTITLQGGLPTESYAAQPLLAALDGNTLSKTPLTVPGGLVGILNLGGEVTATAEIAGPVSGIQVSKLALVTQSGTAVTLPIKVKLDNPVLGPECYIGSDAEPIVLHLTTGTTSPPPPNTPIKGARGTLEGKGKGRIVGITGNSLVDNSYSVPGATGCGGALAPIIDLAVDLQVGLPAPAGTNTAIMNGGLEETTSFWVKKYKIKTKKH
jgi:hypothetical protein